MLARVLGLLMCICVQYKQRQQNCATDAGKAHDELIYAASQLERAFFPLFCEIAALSRGDEGVEEDSNAIR